MYRWRQPLINFAEREKPAGSGIVARQRARRARYRAVSRQTAFSAQRIQKRHGGAFLDGNHLGSAAGDRDEGASAIRDRRYARPLRNTTRGRSVHATAGNVVLDQPASFFPAGLESQALPRLTGVERPAIQAITTGLAGSTSIADCALHQRRGSPFHQPGRGIMSDPANREAPVRSTATGPIRHRRRSPGTILSRPARSRRTAPRTCA